MDPSVLKYAPTHEWSQVIGDVVTIGISDFAVKALTDLVYIGLPEVGQTVSAGDAIGEVESVKAVSDLYSPIAGEVVETNTRVVDDLDLLSSDPMGDGWLLKIKIADAAGLDGLLDRAAYEAHCAAESQ